MSHTHGVDSEVGRLRTVLAHRPGAELKRITPRARDQLLFAGLPWVGRAQQEHDTLTQVLRDHGVEVLYVTEMLQDTLEYPRARDEAVTSALGDPRLGDQLRADLRGHLEGLDPEALAQVLVAGLAVGEFRAGRGLVYGLLDRHDFVLDPLPNLVFTRDSSVWIGPEPAVAGLAGPARRREPALIAILYRHHPRFASTSSAYEAGPGQLDGGDVLQLAPGVLAVGISGRTTAAGAERLARHLFDAGRASAVLAVPMAGHGNAHLDTVCTVLDVGTVLMFPALAYLLRAHTITPAAGGLRVSRPQPFLAAAAEAIGVAELKVISTGLDPAAAARQQWDDGGNALVIAPKLMVSHERHTDTHARLAAAGIEVITVPGSELGSVRGGPRCMSCAVSRDPVARQEQADRPAPAAEVAALPAPERTQVGTHTLVPAATSALG
ncbi:MAG TPA: arginine deiminase [Streptosporangiaceae bacterium]|nr:arginine deiminase [Streptosporangiaceae bacterium]